MQIAYHMNYLTVLGFFKKENYSALPRSEVLLTRPFPACIHFLAFPFQSIIIKEYIPRKIQSIIIREYIPRKMENDLTV